jgi:hypothetical protein
MHWRKNLAYFSTTYAGDGFALVGVRGGVHRIRSTAPAWIGSPTRARPAVKLITAQRQGERIDSLIERHNFDFSRSYDRLFTAIYQDKYDTWATTN